MNEEVVICLIFLAHSTTTILRAYPHGLYISHPNKVHLGNNDYERSGELGGRDVQMQNQQRQ